MNSARSGCSCTSSGAGSGRPLGSVVVGESSLFVTTLVYVAARILGAPAGEPWLAEARALFATDRGVRAIPTWGKFWLSMLSLYDCAA